MTAQDLKIAVASSPFAVQMNTMDRDKQASLRGLILKRLVGSRLLHIEAETLGLEKKPAFKRDLTGFTNGLLFHQFLNMLRETVKLPVKTLKEMRLIYKGQPDAYTAAKSAKISERYRSLRVETVKYLQDRYHIVLHQDQLKAGITRKPW